jgi:hypothetical protein
VAQRLEGTSRTLSIDHIPAKNENCLLGLAYLPGFVAIINRGGPALRERALVEGPMAALDDRPRPDERAHDRG